MSIAYRVTKLIQKRDDLIVCLLPDATACESLYQTLRFILSGTERSIAYLPDYEIEIDDALSPSQAIISKRLATLYQLCQSKVDVLILTQEVAQRILPSPKFVKREVLHLTIGETLDLEAFRTQLTSSDYYYSEQVTSPGSFAIRGGIVDLYPPQLTNPIRIELDDTEISSIQYFSPETQRSLKQSVKNVEICPAVEYNLNVEIHPDLPEVVKKTIKSKQVPTGWQQYLPNLTEEVATLFDYLPSTYHLISPEPISRYLTTSHSISEALIQKLMTSTQVEHDNGLVEDINLSLDSKTLKQDIDTLTRHRRILIVCQSHFRLHQLESILLSHHIDFKQVDSFYESSSKSIRLALTHGELSDNIHLAKDSIIPEHNLTDKVVISEDNQLPSMPVDTLNIGDLLVHIDHGVGKFIGIETRKISGITQDFVVIQYANNDQLLFPPDQLFKVHPYHGDQSNIDELKSKRWQRRKDKALKNIEAFSAKLLRLESARVENKTNPLPLPSTYTQFVNEFPFTETQDQKNIMDAIIHNFKQPMLFDRLVCGDVGFGKTEIAMRAAFIALANGYQVAIIAPTTVLATQHYNNFKDRFKSWSFPQVLLSRSNQTSEKERERITLGEVKLIIGTHKVLSQSFDKLGLVIIDEEHRFGVSQKDSIQAFNQAHKLSLTATPIPRTLNMALSKLRQLSIMTTPPKSRLPIQTFVDVESDELIIQALNREIHRGGQAYIIYNDVASMDQAHKRLDKLCPHISFGTVHGQMPARAVEKQMARFHSRAFQVLIASTIIESGVDIPNANTIIIFRADKLGLAQLHQIRGRVGRSHHQAYAYLLTPHKEIGNKALMRLEAIASATHLGSGYELSIADLEIRGAGNLLGDEQSGHVNAIGLSYYTHLLDQATGDHSTPITEIDLGISAIIPEEYITITELRYQFYHRIANSRTTKTLNDLSDELEERFGSIPTDLQSLLKLQGLKIQASKLGIVSIQLRTKGVMIDVGETPLIAVSHILETINAHADYQFGGKHHILITHTDNLIQHTSILLNRLEKST